LVRRNEDDVMRRALLIVLTTAAMSAVAMAQPAAPPDNRPQAACPPDAGTNPPTLGTDTSKPLSDQLADSKGVICPPAGVDPGMRQPPPEGGTIKVVPPPGSPGGNPSIQPK
jgi:hypothetical protein